MTYLEPTKREIARDEHHYGARNYAPLPVVLTRGQGVWLWDEIGQMYLDMMGAYSDVSHGHGHPRMLSALLEQAEKLCVVSRAFHTEKLGAFLRKACEVTHQDRALPMNTGAEAVETALKAARKWAYKVKGVEPDKAEIISCEGNFHGRTIAIVGMSSHAQYRDGFGPFPPGFKQIPFGDADALEAAITPNTAAFLVEPIQGEGGIIVPPPGYLRTCSDICRANDVLLMCDEVQTGLGRTGTFLASDAEGIVPDGLMLGKALGGGVMPVSLFLAREDVMDVFAPGDHGSTFGGNPIAAAVGLEALTVLEDENLVARSAKLGAGMLNKLKNLSSPYISEVRGRGLFVGIQFDLDMPALAVCQKLMGKGILTKDTNRNTVRFAPPLVIESDEIDTAISALEEVLAEWSS